MARLSDLFTIANDTAFQGRCYEAITSTALAVMSEDPAQPHHAERVIYARTVIGAQCNFFSISSMVLTNPTIQQEANLQAPDFGIVDNDISFVMTTIFDALAGVSRS